MGYEGCPTPSQNTNPSGHEVSILGTLAPVPTLQTFI